MVYDEGPRGPRHMFAVEAKDKDNVGFLCVDYVHPEKGIQKKPVGTCFFVTVWNHNHSFGTGYIVTAKHVWEEWFKDKRREGYVRLNKAVVNPGETGVVYRPLQGKWYQHDDPSVDLAVLQWADADPESAEGRSYTCYSFDVSRLTPSPAALFHPDTKWPPGEGYLLYYVGLLPQYHGTERNFPVVRSGSLALVTDELIEGNYGPSHYHLIDMQSYKGHSGGPVWMFYHGMSYLLGVLVAADPEKQEVLVRKTVEEDDMETVAYYNLGISFVTPVSKLIEILESEEMKQDRQKAEPKPRKPEPLSLPDDDTPLTKEGFNDVLKRVSRKVPESQSKDSDNTK